jgi:hypothetical protein
MATRRTVAVVLATAAAGLTLLAASVGSAGASPTSTHLSGGTTSVVIAPGTAGALLSHDILPLPIAPGAEVPATSGTPTLKVSFPVTGGHVNLTNLTGTIEHSGGLDFYDVATGKSLVIDDFDIVLGATPELTAKVPALGVRVPVFDLGLSAAKITTPGRHAVDVADVAVTLDPVAAGALNSTLGTTLFAGGLPIGTASTDLLTAYRW